MYGSRMASLGSACSAPVWTSSASFSLFVRQSGALVVEAGDLAFQLAHRPVAADAFDFVEGALERVLNGDRVPRSD